MSETPTPPSGFRVEHDVRNEYADGIERLQTRLVHIGLFLLAAVMLGGGAGVLMVATGESRAVGVSATVIAGCVVAVLIAIFAAMSATRQLTPLVRRPAPMVVARPVPPPAREPVRLARPSEPAPAPLWARPSEQQVTITDDPGQRREVFVKLARRLQSLINRAIKRIDELEQENEDPELLDGLYEIDHLFTLARRQGENLAVLGGEAPQRRSNKPVSVYAVLLAAVSEAEHYRQISIVPVEDVEIHGHAVAEIIHLLAELLENATRFTSPDGPKVEVRAHQVTAGLAIEVQDRGLGMSYEDLERINSLLDGSTRIDLSELLEDGRIGLAVVRELARRHDIRVRLQSNIFGGIAAAVVIPPQLLSEPERESRHRASAPQHRQSALPKRHADSPPGPDAAGTGARTATLERPVPAPGPRNPSEQSGPIPVPGTQNPLAEQSGPMPAASAQPPAEESGPIQVPAPPPIPGWATPSPQPRTTDTHSAELPGSLAPEPAEQSGPIQVPAPMPIPPAAVPSRAARPAQSGRRHLADSDTGTNLPVRRPGRSYDELRAGGTGGFTEEITAEQGDQPPPLPQRRGSHLREELLEPPAVTRPVTGHNTNLMKTVQAGRDNWLAEQNRESTRKGDQWPTT